MNCISPESKLDWKAYVLRELGQDAHRQAEAHLAACSTCHEEVATLRLTLDTLSTLREEELPRRIAFVSDKVFEPRWYQKLFLRPSFAAAAVIAAAILVHAFVRPMGVPANAAAQVDTRAIETRVSAEVTARLQSEM